MGMGTYFTISVLASILILGTLGFTDAFAQLSPGDIIIADQGANAIIKVDPITGAQTLISSGDLFSLATTLDLDSNGDIIVADVDFGNAGGNIIKVDPITGDQTLISTGGLFDSPATVGIASNGDIIVVDAGFESSFVGRVIKVDPDGDGGIPGSAQTIISSGGSLFAPFGITFDDNNNILVTDIDYNTGINHILSVDPITGA